MRSGKKKGLKIVGIIAFVILIIAGGGFIALQRGLPEMQALVINDVNPEVLPDGEYTGEFSRYRWSNKVKVTIEGGRIVAIQPENSGGLERELSEQIMAKQSLQVDIKTGATVSSNAFLKAVEDALSQ